MVTYVLDPRFLRIGRESVTLEALVAGMATAAAGVGATAQRAARVRVAKEEMNIIVYGC